LPTYGTFDQSAAREIALLPAFLWNGDQQVKRIRRMRGSISTADQD